jgi:hypothetical protein
VRHVVVDEVLQQELVHIWISRVAREGPDIVGERADHPFSRRANDHACWSRAPIVRSEAPIRVRGQEKRRAKPQVIFEPAMVTKKKPGLKLPRPKSELSPWNSGGRYTTGKIHRVIKFQSSFSLKVDRWMFRIGHCLSGQH